jgi:hypothetical protein
MKSGVGIGVPSVRWRLVRRRAWLLRRTGPRESLEPFRKVVESEESDVIHCRAPESKLGGARCQKIKRVGALLICQVQTLEHVKEAVEHGAGLIVAQGAEAGGHGVSSILPIIGLGLSLQPVRRIGRRYGTQVSNNFGRRRSRL